MQPKTLATSHVRLCVGFGAGLLKNFEIGQSPAVLDVFRGDACTKDFIIELLAFMRGDSASVREIVGNAEKLYGHPCCLCSGFKSTRGEFPSFEFFYFPASATNPLLLGRDCMVG